MDIKFISSTELHCIFTESGIYWHDFKNNRHLLFPYGSIKHIFFVFGYLFIQSESQLYKAFFPKKERKKLKDAIEYARNLKKISKVTVPIEVTKNSGNQ